MNFDAAIEYLNSEIEQEGTRSECGQVLVVARDRVGLRDASLLDCAWVEQVGHDIYEATADSISGYGDTDYASEIEETLRDILDIKYEGEFE